MVQNDISHIVIVNERREWLIPNVPPCVRAKKDKVNIAPRLPFYSIIISITRVMLAPVLLIIFPGLRWERNRHRDRPEWNACLLKLIEARLGERPGLVDTVHRNAMAGARDMQAPVPSSSDIWGLRVERIVPAAAHDFDPAFDVAGEVELVGAPGPLSLLGHVLRWDGIPIETAICGELDALWPAASARVGPALAADLAVVNDDLLGPG